VPQASQYHGWGLFSNNGFVMGRRFLLEKRSVFQRLTATMLLLPGTGANWQGELTYKEEYIRQRVNLPYAICQNTLRLLQASGVLRERVVHFLLLLLPL
jgi:hypothetical protein